MSAASATERHDERLLGLLDPAAAAGRTARTVESALATLPTLPATTFLTVPVDAAVATHPIVTAAFAAAGTGPDALAGVVLDIIGSAAGQPAGVLEDALAGLRAAGVVIAVGGHGAAQPELTSIVRLRPGIIRLGRDWVRGIDRSDAKRSAIEVIGQLAGQLDAWILADGVSSAAELRVLAGLEVPLAQGPFIGGSGSVTPPWPEIDERARAALPRATAATAGPLAELVQQAYTTGDEAAATAVLPETTGFDVVVVVDAHHRPRSLLERRPDGSWYRCEALAVHVTTPVPDAVARALARERTTRFAPVACTDDTGRLLGVVRIERLMARLAAAGEQAGGR